MKLGELFDKSEFVVTGEVGPVRGAIPRDENFVPSMVVFSGDLDRILAAFIIATGAAAMYEKVVMFFTFWGTSVLRDMKKTVTKKDLTAKPLTAK